MLESEIADKLQKNLGELISVPGMRIDIRTVPPQCGDNRFDFIAEASYKNIRFMLSGEIVGQSSMAVFRNKIEKLKAAKSRDKGLVPFIVAPYLSPNKQEMCRLSGINFIDLSGNVFLAHDNIYLERIGFSNKYPENRVGRNPFSDKASLILRQLLMSADKTWRVRELARSVGLDPGFVSRMAKALEAREYVVRVDSNIKLRDPESILDDWIREYSFQKNRSAGYFCMASDPGELLEKIRRLKNRLPDFALSVQAGASLVAPYAAFSEVHLYIEGEEQIDAFRKHLQLKPAEQGANIILMLPYYKHAVFQHAHEIESLKVVSDLQLYLDLYHYPLRGREQAEHLYAKRIKPIIEK